jgi:pheromone a factor receptor
MAEFIPQGTSTSKPLASVLLPTLAGLSVVACLPPLVSLIQSRNVAAVLLVAWITLDNLFNFINPLIWPTDKLSDRFNGAGLCDIEVKLILVSALAIPGALICIFRQLSVILDTEKTTLVPSEGSRRRRLAFELFFCVVCPVYMVVAHFIVQPFRFYVFAISGCVPAIDNSWMGMILIFLPALILCVLAVSYCGLVAFRLLKYRRQFSAILASSNSKVNKARFLRLFILSTTLIVIFLPVAIYVFVRNVGYPRIPFSWSRVHGPLWSKLIVPVATQGVVNFDRYLNVGLGYFVFIFFGLGSDATKMYRSGLLRLGLGRVFPKLERPDASSGNQMNLSITPSIGTKLRSMSTLRAKLHFSHYQPSKLDSTV